MAKLRAVECRQFIQTVIEKAESMGVPVSIAVVGPEGNIIAVERMGRSRLRHSGNRHRQGLYGRRLPLDEPTFSGRAGHPAMVQGA